MRNFKLTLAYDGGAFHGWQRQPGMRTVQEAVEQAARRVIRHQVAVIGAGRTDAGVHAAGQVANFYSDTRMTPEALQNAMGSRLPKDVTLLHMAVVPLSFHATLSAVCKLYRYRVFNHSGRPVETGAHAQTYHFWHPLSTEALRAGAALLVGRHDFTAMASKGSQRTTNVRTVQRCDVYRVGLEVRFDVQGDGFLYNQVRNMVGTLLEVGRGRWPPSRIAEILESRDRSFAGATAPARGLCMQWVRYDLPSLAPDPPDGAVAAPEHSPSAAGSANTLAAMMPPGTSLEEEPGG
ncbi:MAG: tRNA pseudouridine(38-40) synthase TruA [Phycisphaerae bacterium]